MGRAPQDLDVSTLRGRIGASIRKHRIRADISQPALAKELTRRGSPATRQRVSQWEHAVRLPAIEELYVLAAILGTSVGELLPKK